MSDASGVLDSAKTGLQGKIGPVPVWLIALVVGLAAVVGYYVYSRRAVTATVDAAPVASTAETGIVDKTYSTAGYNTANDSAPVDTGSTPTSTTVTTENQSHGYGIFDNLQRLFRVSGTDQYYTIDDQGAGTVLLKSNYLGLGAPPAKVVDILPDTWRYVRQRDTDGVWMLQDDGTYKLLTTEEWRALGGPQAREVSQIPN